MARIREAIARNDFFGRLRLLASVIAAAFVTQLLAGIGASVNAQELPPGVPRNVSPDGTIDVPLTFTSEAYRNEALRLLVQEANLVAKQLNLAEDLPIMESTLDHFFITPFGDHYAKKRIGNITTEHYWYGMAQGNRFSHLCVANYDKTCFSLQDEGKYPMARLDMKTPYQLATQWLATLSIDVKGLNHDSKPRVALSPFWNGLGRLGQKPKKSFVPIYFVWWKSKSADLGSAAYVELFLPKRMLIQLNVEDPHYILRKEVTFTNLAALFPGTALITSNSPPKPKIIRPPGTAFTQPN